MFERYAIFYTPPPGPFADFGAFWLGWDSLKCCSVAHPELAEIDVAALTEAPRKYGFHATFKAPFRPNDTVDETSLVEVVESYAAHHAPVSIEQLVLRYDNGFLALRHLGDTQKLNSLAADIVRELDIFRAPLNVTEIAQRRRTDLSSRQDAQMLEWGYPFIFEDFHFHMTLSGSIDHETAKQIMPTLEVLIDPVKPAKFVIDAITLMGQDTDGLFHQVHRAPLSKISA